MAIRIVCAKDGNKPYAANDVRVFTQDNREIKDILSIDVRFRPNEIVTATIDVVLSPETKLEDLLQLFEVATLEELAESRGYKLVPYNDK